jgi:hypothetical protein
MPQRDESACPHCGVPGPAHDDVIACADAQIAYYAAQPGAPDNVYVMMQFRRRNLEALVGRGVKLSADVRIWLEPAHDGCYKLGVESPATGLRETPEPVDVERVD